MQLTFLSARDAQSVEWAHYALLRDNLQHYVECGAPRVEFGALHSLERVVDRGSAQVNAKTLRTELREAWSALGGLRLEESAVSLRTRAILTGCKTVPRVRATVLARLSGWQLPVAGAPESMLQDVLTPLFEALMAITSDRDEPLTVSRT